ncbi:MAG: AtpZ/AtpI family protein [Nitrospirota bacterium]
MRKDDFLESIEKESRRLEETRKGGRGLWHYVVTACSIGWLIVIPALGGAYLGRFLDRHLGTGGYWTMSFIMLGLGAGIFWIWRQNLLNGGKRK